MSFLFSIPPVEALASAVGTKRRRWPSLAAPCGVKRRAIAAPSRSKSSGLSIIPVSQPVAVPTEKVQFAILTAGPYFSIASFLDAQTLSQIDASSRLLKDLNAQRHGPWMERGDSEFYGMEIDVRDGFFPFKPEGDSREDNWKARYKLFHALAPTFSTPFHGRRITHVERPDEVAYFRCRFRTDHLAMRSDCGVYVEVEIRANADNLSIAVVDFEGGGRRSVTFSPETGAVLREQKIREAPRAIEGTYIHLLPAAPPGERFEGLMGVYLLNGQLAFFRKWSVAAPSVVDVDTATGANDVENGPAARGGASAVHSPTDRSRVGPQSGQTSSWETTGFCTGLQWADGPRLSLCLAFRDPGHYHADIVRVDRTPPISPQKSPIAFQEQKWHHLYGDDSHPLAI